MPVQTKKDSKGCYAQWGNHGKKYYYTCGNKAARDRAKSKAHEQESAAHTAGYRENEMLQRIKVNMTGNTRHDIMEGQSYLVAPMIMLTEGVHEGSGGALLYPRDELSKTPQVWNHKPVVVYHPQHNGMAISACDPIILSNRKIGVIMNTTMGEVTVKNKKGEDVKRPALKAEAWLQEDRMKKVDERISNAIEKNEIMELSTGLFTDNESMEGEWEGEKYEAIARNYRPDHLALLPDLKGACSIEDGAGFLRLNAKRNKVNIVGNSMSHGNIRSLLNSWLRDKDEDIWVEDVYDSFFIFMKDGKYFKGNYSIEDNSLQVSETFVEVVRVSEWRTLNGDFVGNEDEKHSKKEITENENSERRKENNMDEKEKEKIVDALIACNTNSWGKDDKEVLMEMDDVVLEKMQEGDEAAKTAVDNAAKKGAEEATKSLTANSQTSDDSKKKEDDKKSEDDGDEKVAANEKKEQTVEEYISDAPKALRGPLNAMMNTHKKAKEKIIKRITDNERNKFSKEELEAKELPELQKLAAILPVDNTQSSTSTLEMNYDGQDEVEDIVGNKEEPLIAPPVVMAASKK
jgi:hypothetical protein